MRDAAIDPHRQPRRTGAGRPASDRTKGESSAAIAAQRLGSALDRPTGRAPGRSAPRQSRWRLPAFARRVRPLKALTTIAFSAALVGIVANAVLFQKGRQIPLDTPHAASASAPAPVPRVAATPADTGPTGAVSAPPEAAPSPAAPPTTEPSPGATHRSGVAKRSGAKPGGDAIGQLLGAAPAADDASAKASASKTAEAKPDPLLLRAQRQLKTLGYAVKPDGRMDGATRQAIQRFSHDHHLKAEAALTPALRREIADASSTPAKPAAEPSQKAQ